MEKDFLRIADGITTQTIYYQDCTIGMKEYLKDNSIDLIVTSPPYWNLKDYQCEGQIGFGQSLEQYLHNLKQVMVECFRVLKESRRIVINIGDIGISSGKIADKKYRGNFETVPLHAYILNVCMQVGFKFVGNIIWEKISKVIPQEGGSAGFLGSYPYPPNAHIPSIVEYILIFRKKEDVKSRPDPMNKNIREASKISQKTWLKYTSQLWSFPGTRIDDHPAPFPIELPKRCITIWSFVGDTVLDPFLGSGSTLCAAKNLRRNGIGFEINPKYRKIQEKRIGCNKSILSFKKLT